MHALLAAVGIDTPWAVLVLALAGAAVAAAGWRRARRGVVRATAYGAAVLLCLGSVADSINVHFDYLPRAAEVVGQPAWPTVSADTLAADRTDPRWRAAERSGAVVRLPVPDPVSGYGRYDAQVYLPPQYFTEPDRRFPVLYLLHGSPGVPTDWLRGGRAAGAGLREARRGHPWLLVLPRASHGWLDDSECVDGREGAAATYLTVDVVRAVDTRLRTLADRSERAVGGMSAGGFCALNLGLRNRAEYGAVLDLSGETHPSHAGGLGALFGHGPAAAAAAAANDPERYAPRLPAGPTLRVWMDTGSADHAVLAGMRALAPMLREHGVPTRLGVRPGAHTFHVWAPALRDGLDWLAAVTPAPPAGPSTASTVTSAAPTGSAS